jgi:hypothetical protein
MENNAENFLFSEKGQQIVNNILKEAILKEAILKEAILKEAILKELSGLWRR